MNCSAEEPDVPNLGIVFINDSPRIVGNSVSAEFLLTRPAEDITCQLLGTEHKLSGDCKFMY